MSRDCRLLLRRLDFYALNERLRKLGRTHTERVASLTSNIQSFIIRLNDRHFHDLSIDGTNDGLVTSFFFKIHF